MKLACRRRVVESVVLDPGLFLLEGFQASHVHYLCGEMARQLAVSGALEIGLNM
jgi:hypothetical protein